MKAQSTKSIWIQGELDKRGIEYFINEEGMPQANSNATAREFQAISLLKTMADLKDLLDGLEKEPASYICATKEMLKLRQELTVLEIVKSLEKLALDQGVARISRETLRLAIDRHNSRKSTPVNLSEFFNEIQSEWIRSMAAKYGRKI